MLRIFILVPHRNVAPKTAKFWCLRRNGVDWTNFSLTLVNLRQVRIVRVLDYSFRYNVPIPIFLFGASIRYATYYKLVEIVYARLSNYNIFQPYLTQGIDYIFCIYNHHSTWKITANLLESLFVTHRKRA